MQRNKIVQYQMHLSNYMHFEIFILLHLDKLHSIHLLDWNDFARENTFAFIACIVKCCTCRGEAQSAQRNYVLSRLNGNLIRVTSESCV